MVRPRRGGRQKADREWSGTRTGVARAEGRRRREGLGDSGSRRRWCPGGGEGAAGLAATADGGEGLNRLPRMGLPFWMPKPKLPTRGAEVGLLMWTDRGPADLDVRGVDFFPSFFAD
jgi:hypothetical protein